MPQAARRERADNMPIDITPSAVCRDACNLGQRREQQIRTDGKFDRNLEHKNQNRRHERTPTHTSETNNETNAQTDQRI